MLGIPEDKRSMKTGGLPSIPREKKRRTINRQKRRRNRLRSECPGGQDSIFPCKGEELLPLINAEKDQTKKTWRSGRGASLKSSSSKKREQFIDQTKNRGREIRRLARKKDLIGERERCATWHSYNYCKEEGPNIFVEGELSS